MKIERVSATEFRGLNNVSDPIRAGETWNPRSSASSVWLTQADNVFVTSDGALERVQGYTQSLAGTNITGAYATKDLKRLYIVDNGSLKKVVPGFSTETLKTGLSSAQVFFTEVNGDVYYTNGTDFGVIEPSGWRSWGIDAPPPATLSAAPGALPAGTYRVTCTFSDSTGLESGSGDEVEFVLTEEGGMNITVPQDAELDSNVYVTEANGTVFYLHTAAAGSSISYNATGGLGQELRYRATDVPRGVYPAVQGGHMYIGQPFEGMDLSIIWRSLPMQYHHFDYAERGISVPGIVRMVASADSALMIGTDRAVYASSGDSITMVADYGVVPGCHASMFQGKLYFWTLRGLCSAMPFANLTETTVSVPPGISAAGVVMQEGGTNRYVVALNQGGTAFNRRV